MTKKLLSILAVMLLVSGFQPLPLTGAEGSGNGNYECSKDYSTSGSPPNTGGCTWTVTGYTGTCTRTMPPTGTTCQLCLKSYSSRQMCGYNTAPTSITATSQTAPCTGYFSAGCSSTWTTVTVTPPATMRCGTTSLASDPC